MSNAVYFKWGKAIFAVAILAIGVIHLVTGNFPTGLEPVPASLPARIVLVYLTGIALLLAGIMLFINKYAQYGAVVAGVVWLLLLVLLDLPLLIPDVHNPSPWTITFETAGILSGVFILLSNRSQNYALIGRYLFLLALILFGIQHYMYVKFIATLIPAWMPLPMFWAWLVMIAFFAASVSIILHIKVRLTTLLLSAMFLIWVLILHLPRAIAAGRSEPEWTSLFVALAFGGVAMLVAASEKTN